MDRIERIRKMEGILDAASALITQAEKDPAALVAAKPLIDALDEYYSSPLWLQDYDADAQGLIPKDLKRGVLSQDAVYDLLIRYRDLVIECQRQT